MWPCSGGHASVYGLAHVSVYEQTGQVCGIDRGTGMSGGSFDLLCYFPRLVTAPRQMPVQTGRSKGLHLLSGKHVTLVAGSAIIDSIGVRLTLNFPDSITTPSLFLFCIINGVFILGDRVPVVFIIFVFHT